jgi:hypothetical protein
VREAPPRVSNCSNNQKSIDNGGTPNQKKYGSMQVPFKRIVSNNHTLRNSNGGDAKGVNFGLRKNSNMNS